MATLGIRGENPVWFWNNLTGSPVDTTYWMFFLSNVFPYNFQSVFEDPAMSTPWANPIEFQANAGLPDNIYFDPTLVYRLEVRQGPTQSDPLIGNPINNYVPGSSGGSTIISDYLLVAENMITNPQFVDLLFQSPLTYSQSSSGTYTVPVGPGWNVILVGSGSLTLTQGVNDGVSDITGNPAYVMQFTTSGSWTSVILQQQFTNNGAIFSGGAVAVALQAFATGASHTMTVSYNPSTGASTNIIASATVNTGSFQSFAGAVNIPDSTSTDTDGSAYVNINFSLPTAGTVTLSNIQLTGQSTPLSDEFTEDPTPPAYQELTYQRMVDHEFNYYRNNLVGRPLPSYLVGWDFPLNPAQLYGPSLSTLTLGGNNLSQYIWDQTIAFISTDACLAFSRSTDTGGLSVINNNGSASTTFAFVQYIAGQQLLDITGGGVSPQSKDLSVQLQCLINTASMQLKGTVSLYWTTGTIPTITAGTNLSLVSAVAAGGIPTAGNGGPWTAIPNSQGNQGSYVNNVPFILGTFGISTSVVTVGLNGWNCAGISGLENATCMAIVVAFDSIAPTNGITLNYCSLVPGTVPAPPAPQTADEVLRQCQYFYESSYTPGVLPGTVTAVGQKSAPAFVYVDGSGNDWLFARSFTVNYQQVKRAAPSFVIYSPASGSEHQLSAGVWQNNTNPSPTSGANPRDYATSNFNGSGNNSVYGIALLATANASTNMPNNSIFEILAASARGGDEGIMYYHYVADATIGGPIRT